ncbi:MAG: DUF3990 domain-containing protein [Lachnospiraceae bacterium]
MNKNRVNTIKDSEIITIYHGNKVEYIVPTYGLGSMNNDYGRGFYTTPSIELAKEWAWGIYAAGNKSYVHTFELNIKGLNILNLTELDSIYWIAELLYNRKFNIQNKEVVLDNIKILIDKYKLDTSKYDIIIGYRADNNYFTYAESFISGTIYKNTLDRVLGTEELELQVFIKSERAFNSLKKTATEEVSEKFSTYFIKRDKNTRNNYKLLSSDQENRVEKQTIYDFI